MTDLESLARNVRVLLRADLIIAEIHMRQVVARSGLFAAAALAGGFGAVMLGIAGFLALEAIYGAILAAIITGGAALLLAALIAIIGARVKPGRELALANAIHASALDAVNADLKVAGAGMSRVASFVRNPLGGVLPAAAQILFNLVLRSRRRKD